ncbi:hypothetical protein [Pseudidiomarina terrestris]|uniref:hypothetical protein n=1 Tax=Pseudidiomarina terrestris TaxID=2820060 RepID=UPI00264EE926|nr:MULTISPECIES: hypothetical protein [unclassified Pseudidiomarina]MDN7134742.1 hypothetical protein [Pseudidiomarina sp. 1ASP75-5]MEA3587470.1 hypothetical protein [Pseudidiomarina sp. 1APP75-27a]
MKQRRGYILFELVIALSLLAGVLVMSQQWLVRQHQVQQRQGWELEARNLMTALERFWLEQRRVPDSLSELVSKGYIAEVWQPWGQPWQLSTQANLLRLQTQAPDSTEARWLARRIAGASSTVDDQLQLHVWQPLLLALRERYLHRIPDPDAPEYSAMASDLDMGGFSIKNVGLIEAERLAGQTATLQSATIADLRASEVVVTTLSAAQATVAGYDVVTIIERMQHLEQSWQTCKAQGGCQ